MQVPLVVDCGPARKAWSMWFVGCSTRLMDGFRVVSDLDADWLSSSGLRRPKPE